MDFIALCLMTKVWLLMHNIIHFHTHSHNDSSLQTPPIQQLTSKTHYSFNYSPIKAAENRGHAHDHVGNWQCISCIFTRKLLDLKFCGPIAQKEFFGALKETWDQTITAVSIFLC